MDILAEIQNGSIVSVPVVGEPTVLADFPPGVTPVYSGAFVVLGGPQESGEVNPEVLLLTSHEVRGDVVLVAQKPWAQAMKAADQVAEAARLQRIERLAAAKRKADEELADALAPAPAPEEAPANG